MLVKRILGIDLLCESFFIHPPYLLQPCLDLVSPQKIEVFSAEIKWCTLEGRLKDIRYLRVKNDLPA